MIRKMLKADLEQVATIWLAGNLAAHDFIAPDYWQVNYSKVKAQLATVEVYLYEEKQQVLGFIGLVENYVAGIFVTPIAQARGIGTQLLAYVKTSHSELTLAVYQKNQTALRFYLRAGFQVFAETLDDATGEVELQLSWHKP